MYYTRYDLQGIFFKKACVKTARGREARTINGTPYIGPIQGSLHDGMQIHVSGVAEHHHSGFLISLQNGPNIDPRSECVFVFNPRFNENAVIRNSLNGGQWGGEERHGGFPFHKGQHFEVTILVKDSHFRVSINGRHFCDYNHRMPKHMATYITIEQGIRIKQIRFEHGHHHHRRHHKHHQGGIGSALGHLAGAILGEIGKPQHHPPPPSSNYPGASGYPGPAGYPGQPAGPIYNPPVPFVHNMPGGLYPNKMIYISGIPHPNPSRFNINFDCGYGGDVAFVFDVRFLFGNDRNVLVRNNKQGGAWKHEERHAPYFPFLPNAYFDIMILVEGHCFKVAVNNQHLLEFYHRVQPLQRIDTLRIDGDVRLTQVRFQ